VPRERAAHDFGQFHSRSGDAHGIAMYEDDSAIGINRLDCVQGMNMIGTLQNPAAAPSLVL
jgi:hypothetical protein